MGHSNIMIRLSLLPLVSAEIFSASSSIFYEEDLPFLDIADIPHEGITVSNTTIMEWYDRQLANLRGPQIGRYGMKLPFSVLNLYGCWCYSHQSYGVGEHGKGTPQDEFDHICRDRHMGYDCMIMDAPTEIPGLPCTPGLTGYSWQITPVITNNLFTGEFIFECDNSIEADWCKAKSCMIDLRFLHDMNVLSITGHGVDNNLYHANGFDTDACPGTPPTSGGGTGVLYEWDKKVCCGQYPYRMWYWTTSTNVDDRECCEFHTTAAAKTYDVRVGHMYHDDNQDCCLDNTGLAVSLADEGNCF